MMKTNSLRLSNIKYKPLRNFIHWLSGSTAPRLLVLLYSTVIYLQATEGHYVTWPLMSMKPAEESQYCFPLQPQDSIALDRPHRPSLQLFRLNHPFKPPKSRRILQKAPDHHHQSTLPCIACIRLERNHVSVRVRGPQICGAARVISSDFHPSTPGPRVHVISLI